MNVDKVVSSIPTQTDAERAKLRENAGRWLNSGNDAQRKAAAAVIEALDRHVEAMRLELYERVSAMDVRGRVAEAFRARPLTQTERDLIQALLDSPGASSSELSEAMGWKGKSWHLHFAALCKAREDYLWPVKWDEGLDANFWCGILATYGGRGERWTMKPEVVDALAAIGITARSQ